MFMFMFMFMFMSLVVNPMYVQTDIQRVHPEGRMLDRSAHQPTKGTVANGVLIYPAYILVDTPTCDVIR